MRIILKDTIPYGVEYEVKLDFTNYRNITNVKFVTGVIDPKNHFRLLDSNKIFIIANDKIIYKNIAYFRGITYIEGIVYLISHTDTVITLAYPIKEQFFVK